MNSKFILSMLAVLLALSSSSASMAKKRRLARENMAAPAPAAVSAIEVINHQDAVSQMVNQMAQNNPLMAQYLSQMRFAQADPAPAPVVQQTASPTAAPMPPVTYAPDSALGQMQAMNAALGSTQPPTYDPYRDMKPTATPAPTPSPNELLLAGKVSQMQTATKSLEGQVTTLKTSVATLTIERDSARQSAEAQAAAAAKTQKEMQAKFDAQMALKQSALKEAVEKVNKQMKEALAAKDNEISKIKSDYESAIAKAKSALNDSNAKLEKTREELAKVKAEYQAFKTAMYDALRKKDMEVEQAQMVAELERQRAKKMEEDFMERKAIQDRLVDSSRKEADEAKEKLHSIMNELGSKKRELNEVLAKKVADLERQAEMRKLEQDRLFGDAKARLEQQARETEEQVAHDASTAKHFAQ